MHFAVVAALFSSAAATAANSCPCPNHPGRTYCPLDKSPGQCDKPSHPPCELARGTTCPAVPWSSSPPKNSNPMAAGKQISGPASMDPETVAAWHKNMQAWREEYIQTTNYTGQVYSDPQLVWTQTSYMQPQMHPYDRYFYDPATHQYTVQKWLDDVTARYGGVDSILMWPTYTNIGADDRSQFDLFEAMPGGLSGVRAAIDELHAAGVKVLIPYNPWDIGTRRCGSGGTCGGSEHRTNATTVCNASICNNRNACTMCDARVIAGLLKEMNGDGFNGDTMGNVPEEFYQQGRLINHSIAIEPEGGGGGVIDGQSTGNWDTMGWGYWKYPDIPNIDTWKWLDSRRMTNVCERWQIDHTNALQGAWFNGVGFETWENVWGTWNGITERDGEQIRRLHVLLRFLGGRGYLRSQGWLPHSGTDQPNSVFASYWPLHDSAAWTVVSRGKQQTGKKVTLANVPLPPSGVSSWHYYDLWAGVELEKGHLQLVVEIDGYGAMLATPNSTHDDPELAELLSKMKAFSAKPLASFDPTWKFELGSIVKQPAALVNATPPDMVRISGGKYRFVVQGVEIEGGGRDYNDIGFGVDVQHPWEPRPNRFHSQYVNVKPYLIDITPVTHEAFASYLRKLGTSALPVDRYHYLLNWDWSDPTMPKPHPGNGSLPVTYIGYAEAKAYCSSLGRRLPTEIEWQYAAQGTLNGTDGEALLYPWGQADNETLRPKMTTGNIFRGPEPVDRYSPPGDSTFGLKAMSGNVWQMTDQYVDGHTSSVILRGGSNYRPSGSGWYLPQTLRGDRSLTTALNEHQKYFLMDDRYERAGTIGFRCAADVSGSPGCSSSTSRACGSFDAPDAYTTLTGNAVKDWATYGRKSRMANGSGALPANVTGEALTYCPQLVNSVSPATSSGSFAQPQIVKAGAVSFSFTDGNAAGGASAENITTGLCSPSSLRFTLPVPASQAAHLTLWAGVFAGTLLVNASFAGTEIYSEELTAAPSDFTTAVLRSNRFDFFVPATARNSTSLHEGASQLLIDLTVLKPRIPPPPPPPPPPAPLKKCVPVAPAQMCLDPPGTCQNRRCPDVGLDWPWIGGLDWLHWVKANFVRKRGEQTLINCACKGKPCTCLESANVPGQPYAFYNNNPTTFSWSNGTSPLTGSRDPQGADLTGAKLPGGTMENIITVPAADDDVVVHLFTGTYASSTGSLNVSLLSSPDGKPLGSMLRYEFTKGAGGITNQHFTIRVPPAKPKSSLDDVESRVLHTSWSGSLNIELQSIAVTTRNLTALTVRAADEAALSSGASLCHPQPSNCSRW